MALIDTIRIADDQLEFILRHTVLSEMLNVLIVPDEEEENKMACRILLTTMITL